MRRIAFGSGLLLVVALLLFLFAKSREPSATHVAEDVEPTAAALSKPDPSPLIGEQQLQSEPASEREALSAAGGPECTIRARVVGQRGEGLGDVEVFLRSMEGPWSKGKPLGLVDFEGSRCEGLKAVTDETGWFRIRAPLPSSEKLQLWIEETAMHAGCRRESGSDAARNLPPFVAGKNLLDDILLDNRGVVRGLLRGTDGSVIAGADLWLVHPELDPDPEAISKPDGTFEFRDVPTTRECTVGIRAEQWLTQWNRKLPVLREGRSKPLEFHLESARSIRGRVVDELGAACANVYVKASPVSYGRDVGALTQADGSFTIWLGENEAHKLEVIGRDFHETPGEEQASSPKFEAGAEDALLVVQAEPTMLFRVVDNESGAPVSRFELSLASAPVTEHAALEFWTVCDKVRSARGEISIAVTPGEAFVAVAALGFAPLECRVVNDSGMNGLQTLRLLRGGVIVGRLLGDSKPVKGAQLTIERDLLKLDPSQEDAPYPEYNENYAYDLGDVAGEARELAAKSDGTFQFEHLRAGTYRISIQGKGFAAHKLAGLRVEDSARLDLGAIELGAQSRLQGTVLVPKGMSASGIWVSLFKSGSTRQEDNQLCITDLLGGFAFEGLAQGEYGLLVAAQDVPPASWMQLVSLAAGETRKIVVDLKGVGSCEVEARILLHGEPLAKAEIAWVPHQDSGWMDSSTIETDASGKASGSFPAGIPGRFVILFFNDVPAGKSEQEFTLPIGGRYDTTIELVTGALTLELPASLTVPKEGKLSIYIQDPSMPSRFNSAIKYVTPKSSSYADGDNAWTGRMIELGPIAIGEYNVAVMIENGDEPASKPLEWEPKPARIRANETTRVVWP